MVGITRSKVFFFQESWPEHLFLAASKIFQPASPKAPIPVSFAGDRVQQGRLLISAPNVSVPWVSWMPKLDDALDDGGKTPFGNVYIIYIYGWYLGWWHLVYIYYTTYKNGEFDEFCDDSTSIISPYLSWVNILFSILISFILSWPHMFFIIPGKMWRRISSGWGDFPSGKRLMARCCRPTCGNYTMSLLKSYRKEVDRGSVGLDMQNIHVNVI